MIRIRTTRYLRGILGCLDREVSLNDDLLADLAEVTDERDRFRSAWTSARRRATSHRANLRALCRTNGALAVRLARVEAERDRLLAEQTCFAAGSLGGHDVAERLQATAAAADLPIGPDATPDDWHRAVRAAIEDIQARKAAAAEVAA